MVKKRPWVALLLALLAVDALVFLGAFLPGELGYVGSESFEWTRLGISIVSRWVGLALLICLFFAWFGASPPSEGP